MLSWRRLANHIPYAGKAAGDEETDDCNFNSVNRAPSAKACMGLADQLKTFIVTDESA